MRRRPVRPAPIETPIRLREESASPVGAVAPATSSITLPCAVFHRWMSARSALHPRRRQSVSASQLRLRPRQALAAGPRQPNPEGLSSPVVLRSVDQWLLAKDFHQILGGRPHPVSVDPVGVTGAGYPSFGACIPQFRHPLRTACLCAVDHSLESSVGAIGWFRAPLPLWSGLFGIGCGCVPAPTDN